MTETDGCKRPPPDPIYTLRGTGSPVTCLKVNTYDPDQTDLLGADSIAKCNETVFQTDGMLYSGTADGQVHSWSMNTHRIVANVPAHTGHSVLWLDFIGSGHRMVSLGRDGQLLLWSGSDSGWTSTGRLAVASMGFCDGCLLSQCMVAVPGKAMSQADLIDINTMKVIGSLKPEAGDTAYGMCMTMAACGSETDKSKLLIGYEDGSIALWDTRQNKMVDRNKQHEDCVMCLGYSPVLSRGYSGSSSTKLCSWDVTTTIVTKDTVDVTNAGFNDVTVRSDGKIAVFAGWDGNVRIFGCKRLKPLAVLNYHKESVQCVTFSDDNILACGSKDQHISLWDLYR